MPDKAFRIAAKKLKKETDYTQIKAGESRILETDWGKIATKCKGEAALLAALKIEDARAAVKEAERNPS